MHRRINGFTVHPADCRGRHWSEQFIDQHVNSILHRITVATSHRFLRESSDKAEQMTLFFSHRPGDWKSSNVCQPQYLAASAHVWRGETEEPPKDPAVKDVQEGEGINLRGIRHEHHDTIMTYSRRIIDKRKASMRGVYDDSTGLQNNGERWYDAKTGSWVSKDPIGFTAGDTNAQRYCGNSPTNYTDPSGLWIYVGGEWH